MGKHGALLPGGTERSRQDGRHCLNRQLAYYSRSLKKEAIYL